MWFELKKCRIPAGVSLNAVLHRGTSDFIFALEFDPFFFLRDPAPPVLLRLDIYSSKMCQSTMVWYFQQP